MKCKNCEYFEDSGVRILACHHNNAYCDKCARFDEWPTIGKCLYPMKDGFGNKCTADEFVFSCHDGGCFDE